MVFCHAFAQALEELVHLPANAGELLRAEVNEAWVVAVHDVVKEVPDLAVLALAASLVDLVPELGDALGEECLLVQRLLAMPQLRHALEFIQDIHRLGVGREHLRLRLALAVHHQAGLDIAHGAQLGRLFHQAPETIPEPSAPGGVLGDVLQGHLLASHCRQRDKTSQVGPLYSESAANCTRADGFHAT
ncbi:uncharacterized protein [Triticum aestivum]|uniref:uncharacterized protein n=1 Tax=Triticum aestivum TaxID=4565 RepID=UPI001D02710D|nr:uncharacterized protein LOC123129763 [Triticum aestivum]